MTWHLGSMDKQRPAGPLLFSSNSLHGWKILC